MAYIWQHLFVFLVLWSRLLQTLRSEVLPAIQHSTESTPGGYVQLDAVMLNLTKYAGDTVRVRCEITGFPLPRYRWRHNGVAISAEPGDAEKGRRDVKTTPWGSRLKIEDLILRDSGIYTCEGQNGFGHQTTTGHLEILPGPNPNKENNRIRISQHDFHDDDDDDFGVIATNLDVRYDEMEEKRRRDDETTNEDEDDHWKRGGGEDKRKNTNKDISTKLEIDGIEGSCQRYHGNLCTRFLSNRSLVFVAGDHTHQRIVETNLAATLTQIASSNDVTQECLDFVLPVLCRYSFPECDLRRSKLFGQLCVEECKYFEDDVCKEPYRLVKEHGPSNVPVIIIDCHQMAISDRSDCRSITSLERRHDNAPDIKSATLYILIPSIGLPLFVVMATVLSVVCRRCSKTGSSPSKTSSDPKTSEANPMMVSPVRKTLLEVGPEDVTFLTELGEGVYGKLYVGSVRTGSGNVASARQAFIKVLTDRTDPGSQEMVRQEAMRLVSIDHPNVARIFGVVLGGVANKSTSMLYEHLDCMDLRQFLLANVSEENQSSGDRIRVTIIRQVASAADYFAARGLVHRDIAARNVLVGRSMLAKLCDFGLSRFPYEDDYCPTEDGDLIPVRWMSPEAILQGQYSEASDVWAFGVLVWEVFNPESRPYEGQTDEEVIGLLRERRKWSFAWFERCPPQIRALASECWNDKPFRRPRFKDILEMLCHLEAGGELDQGQPGFDSGQLDDTPTGSNSNTSSTNASPVLPCPVFPQQPLYYPATPQSIQCYAPLLSPTFLGPSNRPIHCRFPYGSTPNSPVKMSPFPHSGNSKYWYHWSPPNANTGLANLV